MVDLNKKVEVIMDHERVCDCCIHNGDCSGGIHGGPNGPIYPPCAECDPLVYMDTDLIAEVYDEIMEEQVDEH